MTCLILCIFGAAKSAGQQGKEFRALYPVFYCGTSGSNFRELNEEMLAHKRNL